jgi:SAM-dependent methyltransferase
MKAGEKGGAREGGARSPSEPRAFDAHPNNNAPPSVSPLNQSSPRHPDLQQQPSLNQHQTEIQSNLQAWQRKPLLRQIYQGFYARIIQQIDVTLSGRVLEIGSGIGNLREHYPQAIATDLFENPWLDLVCDGYELPFQTASLSHLILFDVFHHLEAPLAFLTEAQRVLVPNGRVIIFDPYISLASAPAYGIFHHEPIAWSDPISLNSTLARPRRYYAAQGNATRLFFQQPDWLPNSWQILNAQRFAAFAYLLSGGFSKPSLYPAPALHSLQRLDQQLSRFPNLFAARCLVTLRRTN